MKALLSLRGLGKMTSIMGMEGRMALMVKLSGLDVGQVGSQFMGVMMKKSYCKEFLEFLC
jgi:hypothetical protein